MRKTLIGKLKNNRFAFFWLLVGGGTGNILMALYSSYVLLTFFPSAVLSILMAIIMANQKRRPKIWLGVDLILTSVLAIFFVPFLGTSMIRFAIFLPSALIVLGCILGIMDW